MIALKLVKIEEFCHTLRVLNRKNFTYLQRTINISLFFKKILFICFQREGREREREGKKHQCVVASHMPPTVGTWPTTQACGLTGNRTSDPVLYRLALNPLSHTSQGYKHFFNEVCNPGEKYKGSCSFEVSLIIEKLCIERIYKSSNLAGTYGKVRLRTFQ